MSTALSTDPIAAPGRVVPMPRENVAGPGRDTRFDIPQFFFELNGRRTAFADSGTDGPAVIFIHGLAGNVTHWVNVVPEFVRTHRVIAVDLFGQGESTKPTDHLSTEMYVRQVRQLMDILGIETATIVGHSMGGMVAAAFALGCAHRTEQAVLVNPAGMQPMPGPIRLAGHAVLRQGLLNRLLPRVWKTILANVFYTDNEYTRAFYKMVDTTYDPARDVADVSRVMDLMRRDLLDRNYADLLPQITLPVFLIWGDKDRLVPARALHRASRELPNVWVDEIENCGHMPIIERPERVIAFLRRALSTPA